jgi:hypothetical protein
MPAAAVSASARAPAKEREASIVKLRTGTVKPVEHAAVLILNVAARSADGDFELLELRLPPADNGVAWVRAAVKASAATVAFTSLGESAATPAVWLRRAKAESAAPVDGEIFTPATEDGIGRAGVNFPGHHFRFHAETAGTTPAGPNPAVRQRFYAAFADSLAQREGSFFQLAAQRIEGVAKPPARARPIPSGNELTWLLTNLMGTTTGRTAIEQAVQARRPLLTELNKQRASIKLSELKPPALPRADYAALLKRLARPVPEEPLARLVPADFYYVRAKSLLGFLDVLDLLEDWGEPSADLLDGQVVDRGTGLRYQAELGLSRGELTRLLGPEVVDSLALVGSDPYIHEGSDVTCLFRVKSRTLFDAALAAALSRHAAEHGGVTSTKTTYEGVAIAVSRSADGRVRQHRARVGEVEFVSNSRRALERVLAAALGKAPKLGDEADFRYLLARDSEVPADVLAALSDRFVLSVIGPAQKIGEARRLLARSELAAVANGALLFGWLDGRSPRDLGELSQRKLLASGELRHADGSKIAFAAKQGPSSSWGSPAALEPLIERPPLERVTPTERAAYEQFAGFYATLWSDYVDPAMLRATRLADKPLRERVFLRALPILGRENREIVETVGIARVTAPELSAGLRAVLGLGKDSGLRDLLSGAASSFGPHSRNPFKFDWLGDHVMLGVEDRAELANLAYSQYVLDHGPALEPPLPVPATNDSLPSSADDHDPEFEALRSVYAVVGLSSSTGAAVALETVRAFAGERFHWHPPAPYRDVYVVDVEFRDARQAQHVYYAICPKALVIAFRSSTLARLIDAELAGRAPAALSEKDTRRGQLVLDLKKNSGGAIETIMTWLLAGQLGEGAGASRAWAEAVLRGVPEARQQPEAFRSAARAYLGSVPLTPEGKLFELSAEGVRDPDHGSQHAPIFPELPVAGSPLARALGRFTSLRTEVAFDQEGQLADTDNRLLRSFRSDVTLELGAARR